MECHHNGTQHILMHIMLELRLELLTRFHAWECQAKWKGIRKEKIFITIPLPLKFRYTVQMKEEWQEWAEAQTLPGMAMVWKPAE